MSDPVPAITEAAATGEIATIYADIRKVLGVDVVNLIWRHLATIDRALPWVWGTLRPVYADGSVLSEASALRGALALPLIPTVPVEVYSALGLGPADLTAIREILAAYDHTNAIAVIALSALRACLHGAVPQGPNGAAEPAASTAVPRIRLPRLLDIAKMQPETAALVTALNGLGTRRPGTVLASMYRHLAHWPPYLALAWLLLAPLDHDGRLTAVISQAQQAAPRRADRVLARLNGSPRQPPPPSLARAISTAIEPFVGDVIIKMLVISALLRRVT